MTRLVSAEEARGLLERATPGPWHLSADRETITQTSHVTRDVWTIPRTLDDMSLLAAATDLAATVIALSEERDRLRATLYREGYAPCSTAACNCGDWHK